MSDSLGNAYESRQTVSYKIARVLTELFNPPWVAIGVLGAVAAHTSTGFWNFIIWWAISAFFTSLLPVSFLVQALRRGSVSDWYVTKANERVVPFSIAAASFAVAALVMILFPAPRDLLAVTLAGMAGLFVAIALTPKWKLSIHTGSIAGAVVVLSLVFGPWLWFLALIVPIVGWARIRIAHHTPWQVIVGGMIGAAVATVVYIIVVNI